MNNTFAGHIRGFDDDEETQDEAVLIELTDTNANGVVEIAMQDRNERFHVRFKLQDLVQAAMAHSGGETS